MQGWPAWAHGIDGRWYTYKHTYTYEVDQYEPAPGADPAAYELRWYKLRGESDPA